ncbi:MAG TPA: asparaginase [Porticoccaceae bacterium]|nr:asparaginase domain-containing protein [Porticoccaceae bacterium]HIG67083.1 asparaginase [Porticoccaceae bacterium]
MNKLTILTTGGTIDKVYFDAASEFQVGAPVIEALLVRMNVGFEVSLNQLMRVDSLDMTDQNRKLIRQAVEESDAEHILITHGTDGMVETANWLKDVGEKKIILTGALQPAAFAENDAVFNIGCAIGAIQTVASGVYIAMNGRIFDSNKVVKNRSKNRFELTS